VFREKVAGPTLEEESEHFFKFNTGCSGVDGEFPQIVFLMLL